MRCHLGWPPQHQLKNQLNFQVRSYTKLMCWSVRRLSSPCLASATSKRNGFSAAITEFAFCQRFQCPESYSCKCPPTWLPRCPLQVGVRPVLPVSNSPMSMDRPTSHGVTNPGKDMAVIEDRNGMRGPKTWAETAPPLRQQGKLLLGAVLPHHYELCSCPYDDQIILLPPYPAKAFFLLP